MIRRLFTVAAAISLLIVAAMAALWPRTVRVGDALAYTTASDTSCSVATAPGRLSVHVTRNLPPVAPELQAAGFPQANRGWSSSSVHWGTPAQTFSLVSPPQVAPASFGTGTRIEIEAISVAHKWTPPGHGVLGIGWDSRTYTVGPPIWTRPAQVRSARLMLPLWLLIVGAAVLPAAWLVGRLRANRRRRRGQCLACGYDLRASKDRCPECGTPIPPNVEAPA